MRTRKVEVQILPTAPFKMKFITWKQPLGNSECPYAYRWLINFYFFSIRLHQWIGSDDLRYFHDHPTWFATIVLSGSYIDISPKGEEQLNIGSFRFRPALYKHKVKILQGGCWTLLVFGKHFREWGFYAPKKSGKIIWLKAKRYFLRFGHHPCDK